MSAECIGRSAQGVSLQVHSQTWSAFTETRSSDAAIYGKAGNKQLKYEKSLNRYEFSDHTHACTLVLPLSQTIQFLQLVG